MEEKEIDVMKGNAGYKATIDTLSNCKKRILARTFYEPHTLKERMGMDSYVAKKYGSKKILRKIYKVVSPDTPTTRKTLAERQKYAFQGNIRYIKQEKFSPVSMLVSDDIFWLGFIDKARSDRTYLKINSKELSDAFEEIFNMLWEKAKE